MLNVSILHICENLSQFTYPIFTYNLPNLLKFSLENNFTTVKHLKSLYEARFNK